MLLRSPSGASSCRGEGDGEWQLPPHEAGKVKMRGRTFKVKVLEVQVAANYGWHCSRNNVRADPVQHQHHQLPAQGAEGTSASRRVMVTQRGGKQFTALMAGLVFRGTLDETEERAKRNLLKFSKHKDTVLSLSWNSPQASRWGCGPTGWSSSAKKHWGAGRQDEVASPRALPIQGVL